VGSLKNAAETVPSRPCRRCAENAGGGLRRRGRGTGHRRRVSIGSTRAGPSTLVAPNRG